MRALGLKYAAISSVMVVLHKTISTSVQTKRKKLISVKKKKTKQKQLGVILKLNFVYYLV